MEAEEDQQELPQATPAAPLFPQSNLYEQLLQDITETPSAWVESQGSSLSAQESSSSSHVKSIRISHKVI
jgi:hypothetical protein